MVEPQDKCTRTFEEVLNSVDRNEATDPCSAQWILIWMYGAYIDEVPNDPQRRSIEVFYKTMPDLCLDKCYHKFVNQFPPKVDNRRVLLGWIQMAENSCRIQNGLKPRPFNYKEVMKRWRYPDGYI